MKKALVLSGGGARGSAHIGVIKALEEFGFVPDMIVGVSIGSVVGAGYSLLKDSKALEEYAHLVYRKSKKLKLNLDRILSGAFSKPMVWLGCWYLNTFKSALPASVYFKMFRKVFNGRTFEDTLLEFHAVGADLKTGEVVVMSKGPLIKALEASMAIPGVFPPVEIDGRIVIDGGTVNNLPVDIAKSLGADFVVAVDLSSKGLKLLRKTANAYMTYMDRYRDILLHEDLIRMADLYIKPPVEDVGTLDFSRSLELIQIGYSHTISLLKEINLP